MIKEIRRLFTVSIRYRLIADVPVGSCLSGGIDSSSIVCTMNKLRENNKIKTFSLVFPGLKIDESSHIDEVVRLTTVEVHKVSPNVRDLREDLYDLIWTQEEPFGSLSIYGQYKVMELAHKIGMKVLLDGQGGDELFAGYLGYYRYYLFECLTNLKLREFIETMRYTTRREDGFRLILSLSLSILEKFGLIGRLIKKNRLKKLDFLNDFYKGEITYPLFEKNFNLNQALLNSIIYTLPGLLKYEDRNSMRWSIESRVPFLDYRFVEFVSSLPSNYKIRSGITKYIFRESMNGTVPKKILSRRDKIGSATPDREWLGTPEFISVVKQILYSSKLKSRTYWKYEKVKKIFEEHLNGENDYSGELWRIINTELWLRVFIDEPKI